MNMYILLSDRQGTVSAVRSYTVSLLEFDALLQEV